MSASSAIAHYTAHIPPAAASTPVAAAADAATKIDGDGDLGIEAGGGGQTVNSHLSHAVQQALGHLPAHVQAATSPSDTSAASAAGASGQVLPMTMEGFIRALIASLHQIGTPAGQSPVQGAGIQAVSANSGGYAPAPAKAPPCCRRIRYCSRISRACCVPQASISRRPPCSISCAPCLPR